MRCPNCGLTWEPGEPCPECEHVDGDFNCDCYTCTGDSIEDDEDDLK